MQMPVWGRFVRNGRLSGDKGACRRCGSDADAAGDGAGDGDRDFGEREVTAGIPAGRKGSKGRMWIPEDGAPGDGWRG